MPEETRPAPHDDLEHAADEAVAACGGDLRSTVKALVADNLALQRELDFATLAHSFGYSRGFFARQREARAAHVISGTIGEAGAEAQKKR